MRLAADAGYDAGVYGLNVSGLGDVSGWAGTPLPGSPRLNVRREVGTAPADATSRLFDDQAVIPLLEDGLLEVSRDPAIARFVLPRAISDEELLHPWLVPAAATVCAWQGWRVVHGGIVTDGKRAVAVVGEKEGGKSTLLAWMAFESEFLVMADDLVVVDGDTVFAGPRCIDLRPASVPHLPDVVGSTLARGGTRLRLPLPETPATAEFIGMVVLEWATMTAVQAVPPRDRLGVILPHALTEGIPLGTAGVLGFTKYRMWRLSRPRRWESMPAVVDAIRSIFAEG